MIKKYITRSFFLIFIITFLDQLSKILVVYYLEPYDFFPIIPDFFSIRLIENTGLAFGIGMDFMSFEKRKYLFTLLMIAAILILIRIYLKVPQSHFYERLGFVFILAGALSNLIDKLFGYILYHREFRFLYGKVIDYISFQSETYLFPTFNLADVSITIGLLILFILSEKK